MDAESFAEKQDRNTTVFRSRRAFRTMDKMSRNGISRVSVIVRVTDGRPSGPARSASEPTPRQVRPCPRASATDGTADAEGWTIYGVCRFSDAAVRRRAFTARLARRGSGPSENDRLSGRGRCAAEARQARDDGRRAVEAQERTISRARTPAQGQHRGQSEYRRCTSKALTICATPSSVSRSGEMARCAYSAGLGCGRS